ncbi:MAG: CRISPR-associated endonuclease Cas1 [Acidobacteriota bacterium]
MSRKRLAVSLRGKVLRRVKIAGLRQVVLFGTTRLSSEVLSLLLREGIDTVFLTKMGRYRGRLAGVRGPRPDLVLAQYRASVDPARRLALARSFVEGKIRQQRRVLLQVQRGLRDSEIQRSLLSLRRLVGRVPEAESQSALMGLEGNAARAYWSCFAKGLEQGESFRGRRYRPPPDPINASLSFGYALLTERCDSAVRLVGLDPGVSFLHEPAPRRPSLALDLMEELRPIVVDRVVRRLFNRGELTGADFKHPRAEELLAEDETLADDAEREEPVVHLNGRGRAIVIRAVRDRMAEKQVYLDGQRHSLAELIELQARQLARVLLGREEEYRAIGAVE